MTTAKKPVSKATAIAECSKFKSLPLARAFADRCEKINMIVMGDDGVFWVGLPRYTEALVKAGYEYAK